jgi:hypothetical protein
VKGTKTTAGIIPYIVEPRTGYVFPVKLDYSEMLIGDGTALANPNVLMPPKRDASGCLVYALPGGGEFSARQIA